MNYFIKTFGCQMNVYDSELIDNSMRNGGHVKTDNRHDAGILIFNTCSVRQNAESHAVAVISEAKNTFKKAVIVVCGCAAQRIGEQLLAEKKADLIIGHYYEPFIADIIGSYKKSPKRLFTDNPDDYLPERIPQTPFAENGIYHKYVTITHGCENFCTYCIVPYVRGRLISFQSKDIVSYINKLADSGIIEITLLGQNVNQYGMDSDDIPFYRLLSKVAENKSIKKINFMTSHPKDFNENIVDVIADNENIAKGIHLPLQSGSDAILKLMNRQYDMAHYYEIVSKIKSTLKDYSITTDFIVGFPGETDSDFNDTLNAVKNIDFDDAFLYIYSPREGTEAFKFLDTVSDEEKLKRFEELNSVKRAITRVKLENRVGRTEYIIIDNPSKKNKDEYIGKTMLNHPTVLKADIADTGKQFPVKITEVRGATLFGEKL